MANVASIQPSVPEASRSPEIEEHIYAIPSRRSSANEVTSSIGRSINRSCVTTATPCGKSSSMKSARPDTRPRNTRSAYVQTEPPVTVAVPDIGSGVAGNLPRKPPRSLPLGAAKAVLDAHALHRLPRYSSQDAPTDAPPLLLPASTSGQVSHHYTLASPVKPSTVAVERPPENKVAPQPKVAGKSASTVKDIAANSSCGNGGKRRKSSGDIGLLMLKSAAERLPSVLSKVTAWLYRGTSHAGINNSAKKPLITSIDPTPLLTSPTTPSVAATSPFNPRNANKSDSRCKLTDTDAILVNSFADDAVVTNLNENEAHDYAPSDGIATYGNQYALIDNVCTEAEHIRAAKQTLPVDRYDEPDYYTFPESEDDITSGSRYSEERRYIEEGVVTSLRTWSDALRYVGALDGRMSRRTSSLKVRDRPSRPNLMNSGTERFRRRSINRTPEYAQRFDWSTEPRINSEIANCYADTVSFEDGDYRDARYYSNNNVYACSSYDHRVPIDGDSYNDRLLPKYYGTEPAEDVLTPDSIGYFSSGHELNWAQPRVTNSSTC